MLKGKTALITGASRGIGRAIAFKLAEQKVNLILTGRSEGDLQNTSSLIREKYQVKTKIIVADLLKEDAPAAIVHKAVEIANGLDILINNAGAALSLPAEQTTIERWNQIMNLNARAPFFLCQEAIPYLRKSDCAAIVNISAEKGVAENVNHAAFAASKQAVTAWSKILARELEKDGIPVHLISPEGVDTDLSAELQPGLEKSALISPVEIAEIVVFLLKFRGKGQIDQINLRHRSR